MVKERCKKCALCGSAERPLVKSHIIAKGLLELNQETGHSFAYIDTTGKLARRRDGLFLDRITCRGCEDKIFTPLDNYAIKIFRNGKMKTIVDETDGVRTYKFDDCNRHDLRAFFASLTYRFALGCDYIPEASNVVVDGWLSKLQDDLQNWQTAEFDYVDALCVEFRGIDANSFKVPQKMSIGDECKGFMIDIPHWRFFISIGNQHHPFVRQLFNKGHVEAPLYSLSATFKEFPLCYCSVDFSSDRFNDLIDTIEAYNRNSQNGRRVYVQ